MAARNFSSRSPVIVRQKPWVEAVAIKDGKILVVALNAYVEVVLGDGTKAIELEGRLAIPGLIDIHLHPFTR